MNRNENNMSPGKDEDFEWDISETTVTAWSASHSRPNKGRRAYGRPASKKNARNSDNKWRASQRRRQFQEAALDEESAFIQHTSSHNSSEWTSTSSNSSFELKRSESMPIPPPPGSVGRSKSASTSVPNRPPLLRHSRSMSFRSDSRKDSSSTSTSSSIATSDSRFGQCENTQPNIAPPADANTTSSLLSPQPPTKLKKIDMTPSDIETKESARKKMRQRHYENEPSDSSPSFLSPNNNTFSRLAKSAELAAAWIKPPNLSPSLKDAFGFDFGCLGDAACSSPSYSVTTASSSRKRGVCELPFDDAEESSFNASQSLMSTSSYEGRSRSRSRIFSSGSFSKSIAADDAPDPSNLFSRNGRDIDSHDDNTDDDASAAESEVSDDSSEDHAMDVVHEENAPDQHGKTDSLVPPKPVRRSSNNFEESVFGSKDTSSANSDPLAPSKIFETMSDYEDLKFFIKALRKEKYGSTIASFGTTKTWTVAPPAAWDSRRRTAFLQWASRSLGFSLRAGGGAVAFLQTTVTKGAIVLESLEAALIAHKANEQNVDSDAAIPKDKSPKNVIMLSSMNTRSAPRPGSTKQSPVDGDVDMELLSGMTSLGLTGKKENVHFTQTVAVESEFPLVRLVTLDTTSMSPHEKGVECLPTIMDIAESPYPSSNRPSEEHHVSGHDLVLHLHGLSPHSHSGPPTLPMRRLSRPSASRPNVLRTSNIPFDEDECWETPSVKRTDQFWGSSSRVGRDWGHSTRCPDEIIMQLISRLEEGYKAAGCPSGSPFDALDKITETVATPCFWPPSVASAAVSSAALGFDDASEKDEESDTFEVEAEDRFDIAPLARHNRAGSVGASAFSVLNLNDMGGDEDKLMRKRMSSFAKHRRVSICAAVLPPVGSIPVRRQTTFVNYGPGTLSPRNDFHSRDLLVRPRFSSIVPAEVIQSPVELVCNDPTVLSTIFSFLSERELLCYASPICSTWADAATASHACLMLTSMGFSTSLAEPDSYSSGDEMREADGSLVQSVAKSMERSWKFLMSQFPWACYLSDGSYKKVFKVYNSTLNASEALSVMDVERIDNKTAVAAELAVASMLSSLARRNICPNFIITRSVFTCPYEPPAAHWGSAENKKPRGRSFDPRQPMGRKPREPSASKRGTFQYIRMELCKHGDAEEYIKRLPNEVMSPEESRSILFQTAFALHVAADRYSMKHYDVKLLNIFLQDAVQGDSIDTVGDVTVLRYGLGDHVFALRMPSDRALLAKLADYGTANVQAASNGKPVTIGQFTTIENTPPDYLIHGDTATQGHGHDNFGLGLCMLHLFTGHAPYEEILDDVFCPVALKKKLRQIWVEDEYAGFNAVRTMILLDVDGDEGEPDETLYHTLYRYLVLFGIPKETSKCSNGDKVWKAIRQSLEGGGYTRAKVYGRGARQGRKEGPDSAQFARDRKKYSLSHGNNKYIARARRSLEMMEGGMELLMSLVHFDPQKRATPLDVMNSRFMASLQETPDEETHKPGENVMSFMAYAARR